MMANAPNLTPAQFDEIYRRYITGEKPSSLIAEFDLDVTPSTLFSIFPPEATAILCSRCGKHLVRNRLTRPAVQAKKVASLNCPACKHVENFERCTCKACIEQRLEDARRKQEETARQRQAKADRIRSNYADLPPLNADDLGSASEKALLLILVTRSEDHGDAPLLPNWLEPAYLHAAYATRLIVPSMDGDIPIECFDDDGWLLPTETGQVASRLNIATGLAADLDAIAFNTLRSRMSSKSDAGCELIKSTWLDISTGECMDYLSNQMRYRKLQPHYIPSGVAASIRSMLEIVPQSVLFHAIWKSVKDVVSFLSTDACKGTRHAINTIPSMLDKHFQHRIAGRYGGLDFSRKEQISPRSRLSRIFFNILGIAGDPGFYICVSDWLRDPMCSQLRNESPVESDHPVCTQCGEEKVRYHQTGAVIQIECSACHSIAAYLRN